MEATQEWHMKAAYEHINTSEHPYSNQGQTKRPFGWAVVFDLAILGTVNQMETD